MTTNNKLLHLKARERKIVTRGKSIDSPGALKKVRRQIAALEKTNDTETSK